MWNRILYECRKCKRLIFGIWTHTAQGLTMINLGFNRKLGQNQNFLDKGVLVQPNRTSIYSDVYTLLVQMSRAQHNHPICQVNAGMGVELMTCHMNTITAAKRLCESAAAGHPSCLPELTCSNRTAG